MSHSGQKLLVPKRLSRAWVGVLDESWDLLSLSFPPKEKRAGSPTGGQRHRAPLLNLGPLHITHLSLYREFQVLRDTVEEEKGPAALCGTGLSNHGHGTLSKLLG